MICLIFSSTLMLEYLPSSTRATIVIVIELFWSLGGIFEYLMAMFIVPTYGWRLLTALSALPISIVAACMYVSIHFFYVDEKRFIL
jgi:MFS family permease